MRFKKEVFKLFLSSLILIILAISISAPDGETKITEEDLEWGDEGTTSTSEEYTQKVENTPEQVTTNEMGTYPKETKDNWNRFSESQKDSAFEQHFDKFRDKFKEEWGKKGVNVNPAPGSTYDSATQTLTNPDGTTINLNTMTNRNIEPNDNGVLIDGDQYTNAKNIQGNPDGSISTDSADLIRSDGVRFINLSNSNIRTDESYATIITNESLKITDNTGTVVYVNPIDTGIISVSKTPENKSYYTSDETGFIKVDEQYTRFNITSAVLQYEDEIATANGTISLVVNEIPTGAELRGIN